MTPSADITTKTPCASSRAKEKGSGSAPLPFMYEGNETMSFTDDELEILDTLICGVDVSEEAYETFTNKLLEAVKRDANDICDANEVEFEEFTNNLSEFAIHCKEYQQEWIADRVTELFTDKFFVYAVKKYANSKAHVKADITIQYRNLRNKESSVEETAARWYKTATQIYEQLISDYLFTSGRVQ